MFRIDLAVVVTTSEKPSIHKPPRYDGRKVHIIVDGAEHSVPQLVFEGQDMGQLREDIKLVLNSLEAFCYD